MISQFKFRKSEYGDVFFREPLIEMSHVGRFLTKIFINSFVTVHVILTAILLFTDIEWAFWMGVFNVLYFIDRVAHSGSSDKRFLRGVLPKQNIAPYLTPRARRLVVSAYNKASMIGGGFYINLVGVMFDSSSFLRVLDRLEIQRNEFESKLSFYINKNLEVHKSKEELKREIEQLVLTALDRVAPSQKNIDVADLFSALALVKDKEASALLDVFEIEKLSLERAVLVEKSRNWRSSLLKKLKLDAGGATRASFLGVSIGDKKTFWENILDIEEKYSVFIPINSIDTAINLSLKEGSSLTKREFASYLLDESSGNVSRSGGFRVSPEDILEVSNYEQKT